MSTLTLDERLRDWQAEQQRRRARRRYRFLRSPWMVLIATGVVAGMALVWSWLSNWPPLGGGDPGGKNVGILLSARKVFPPDASHVQLTDSEPRWKMSCGPPGEQAHWGWTEITASMSFVSGLPGPTVEHDASAGLTSMGWSPVVASPPDPWVLTWQKRQGNGGIAILNLSLGGSPGGWKIWGSAAPNSPDAECTGV